MHTPKPLEYCFVCDEPTGRAGQGDGSLYCECDKGPFCEECWSKHHNADAKVTDLLEALEAITNRFEDVYLHCDNGWGQYKDKESIEEAKQAIEKAKEE